MSKRSIQDVLAAAEAAGYWVQKTRSLFCFRDAETMPLVTKWNGQWAVSSRLPMSAEMLSIAGGMLRLAEAVESGAVDVTRVGDTISIQFRDIGGEYVIKKHGELWEGSGFMGAHERSEVMVDRILLPILPRMAAL
jgi:hypothetical protein